jgi:hypothetical protein
MSFRVVNQATGEVRAELDTANAALAFADMCAGRTGETFIVIEVVNGEQVEIYRTSDE